MIPEPHSETGGLQKQTSAIFGFWIYLMSDCLLFASLFAVYAVLHMNTFGGPSANMLFSLPLAFIETLILLTSSFTVGLAALTAHRGQEKRSLALLFITFLLGAVFLTIEISDFSALVSAGHSWQESGFLSSFFALVGTHGLHVFMGSLWLITLAVALLVQGFTSQNLRRLTLLSLFWHFLDLVWIFIFSIVYLMGAL